MDQFRQIGEVLGSMKALMVLKNDIVVNQRQCSLIYDISVEAFDRISDEIRQNLRLDEKSTKWKPLERPLRELHTILRDCETYMKNCVDAKNWLGKAISLHFNRDCVELHIHNLLSCFVVVIEAVEVAAELSGLDEEDMQRRRLAIMKKYDFEWNEPKLFEWKFGKQYLISREIRSRLESVWDEDKYRLLDFLRQRRRQSKLGEELINKLENGLVTSPNLLPAHLLIEASDYCVRRRIGTSGTSHLKEIQWLGESFALRTFYGDVEALKPEISMVMSLSHPNVLQYHCGLYDEERREGFLVMELMSKSLDIFIKESIGQRRKTAFSVPIAVDVMLQIARGMEYLHSRNIFHGDLNPSKILLKPTTESSFHAKVAGFGLSLMKSYYTYRTCPRGGGVDPVIWYAPEVLAEQEPTRKFSEKADVYSFGMVFFQILAGKAPFEEGERPLQGDKLVHSLLAGERPLFPYPTPKFLVNLIRKCWQTSPGSRPGFSSICRILRYVKKVLVINPDHGQPGCPPPLVDYCDIESGYSKKFPDSIGLSHSVSEIPFEMFAYKLVEKEKTSGNGGSRHSDEGTLETLDDLCIAPNNGARRRSACSEIIDRNDLGAFADQRSVISEIPNSNMLLSDHISSLSDNLIPLDDTPASPDWKLLNHQSSPLVSSAANNKKLRFSGNLEKPGNTPERQLQSKTKPQRKIEFSELSEKKQTYSATEQRTVSFEAQKNPNITERRASGAGKEPKRFETMKLGDNLRPGHSESTRKKFLRSMKTTLGLTKIPEKKTIGTLNSPKANTVKTNKPKLSLKDAIFHNNLKAKQSTNDAGKQKYQSPGASPARITGASPARVTKSTSLRYSSPLSSPIHPLKLGSSPARCNSTSRSSFNACPSPSFRGMSKDKSRESYMSPYRQMKAPV